LFSSQPTVSRELARLESLLGIRLFERDGGRLMPTAEALIFYEEVEKTYLGLERINSTAESLRRGGHGQVTINCLPLFSQTLIPHACMRFHSLYPEISIRISAQESPLLEESLSGQRADLGLIEGDHLPRGTNAEVILAKDMVCILPPGHALLGKAALELEDFQNIEFINLSGMDHYRLQVDEQFLQAGISRHQVIETNSVASVCAMVRQGLGVSIINPLTAQEECGRGLLERPIAVSIPYRVMLVRPAHRPSSMLVDAFIQSILSEASRLQHTSNNSCQCRNDVSLFERL
jgi:DNA-binding transcriptional LysR family regulator